MDSKKALGGLKVIECGHSIAVSYFGKLLAELGATVTKLERPGLGDPLRSYGPFPDDNPDPEKSGLFLWLNTNKRSVTLNVECATGREVLSKLLADADVFVHDYRYQATRELGLDCDHLAGNNRRLIVTAITPFGHSGPYRDYVAYHINACAAGGASMGTGFPDREPLTMPLSMGQYQAGVAGATGTLFALLARRTTNKGQFVDISEVDVWIGLHTGFHVCTYLYRGVTGIRQGRHTGYLFYPCSTLECKDGHMCLIGPSLPQWVGFVEMMGTPEWTKNPRYRDRRAMAEKYPDEPDALIAPWLQQYTKEELFTMCRERHIPFAPIKTIPDLLDEPHLKERNFWTEVDHPTAGRYTYPGPAYRMSQTPAGVVTPAPRLGEHTEEALFRLGYTKDDLVLFRRLEVV